MAKFNGYVLTEKGRELLAKGLAGERITFTKMQIGDGTATTDARNMIALVSPKKDLTLLNINVFGGQCELTALLSNHELQTGFYIRELGVFARGNDDTEILYAYNVSPNPDFIPPFNANNIVEIEYVDTLIIDRVANVTAVIDPSITYVTKQMADTLYLEKKRLAEIIGLEFGGNIQDVGQKTTGKFYFDTSTKHYFECMSNNSLTYVDVTKFKPISNKPISDRLENLLEIKVLTKIKDSLYFNISNGFRFGNLYMLNLVIKDKSSADYMNTLSANTDLENIFDCFSELKGKAIKNNLNIIVNTGNFYLKKNGNITLGSNIQFYKNIYAQQQLSFFAIL